MKGKFSQRQLIIITVIVLMIMGGFAAFKMVRSFQDRNNDRREVINDFIPQPSVTN